jgi:hypothetical protein
VATERIPRDKPPDLARRGEICQLPLWFYICNSHQDTETQTSTFFSLSCEPLPNHVLPLAHFGAISGVCDGGVVRTDHHNAGERSGSTQHYDLKVHHASVGGW